MSVWLTPRYLSFVNAQKLESVRLLGLSVSDYSKAFAMQIYSGHAARSLLNLRRLFLSAVPFARQARIAASVPGAFL